MPSASNRGRIISKEGVKGAVEIEGEEAAAVPLHGTDHPVVHEQFG